MSKELISVEHVAFGIGYTDVQSIERTHLWSLQEIADLYDYDSSSVTGWVRSHGGEQWRYVSPDQWPFEYCRMNDDEPSFRFVVRDTLHGKGGRNFLLIAATIAVAVLAPAAGAALYGAGTLGAALTSAALQAGGYYLLGKLFPGEPLKQKQIDDQSDAYADVTSDSNLLARDAFLPIVAGTRRFSPPDVMQPRFSIVDGLQTVDKVMAWYGPHLNSDIWVDKVSSSDLAAITTEIHDGTLGETTYTFVNKIAAHVQAGSELNNFESEDAVLEDQDEPSNSEPKPYRFFTPYDDRIEEVTIRFQINNFYKTTSGTKIRVPIRIRKRPRGGDDESWTYLPEIHFVGKSTKLELFEVRIKTGGFGGDVEIESQLDVRLFREVPAVTAYDLSDGNTDPQWVADDRFNGGSGLKDVINALVRRGQVRFSVLQSFFDVEGSEWEIIRGCATNDDALTETDYTISSNVVSLFKSWDVSDQWEIAASQDSIPAQISLLFASAIADKHPVQRPNTAVVAVRSKGHSIKNVTVLSSGYVMDWGGSAWDTETTTKNPATWYYHILKMMFDAFGVDTSLIDNASIVAWRTECAAKGYEVSMVIAGQTFGEVLQSIAAAGFARPVFGSGWGIDFVRDRSSEDPTMTFSPFNTTDISFNIEDLELPQATRLKFQNEEKDWLPDEMVVNNPFATNVGLQVNKDVRAQSNPDLIRLREIFDLAQTYYQNRQWVVSTFIEHIGCAVGDLVGIVTDIEHDDSSGARVSEVIGTRTVVLNQEIPVVDPDELFEADNIFDVDNIFDMGDTSVLWVTHAGGKQIVEIESVVGKSVYLASDLTDTDIAGAHVVIGPLSRYTKRCYVVGIEPGEDNSATVYCVDEAPEIVTHLQEYA